MNKKDYIALAAAFRHAYDETGRWGQAATGVTIALNNVANGIAADNPRFDRRRFIEAAKAAV